MAEVLDGVMEGKQYTREKQPAPKAEPDDEKEKLKAQIADMQKKLDAKD